MFKRKPKPKLAKKWEGDYTTIKKHYKHVIIPIGAVALAGTITAAVALPIMITKIAKEEATKAFEKIIPIGGTRRVFHEGEKLNYLAIGDSVTAGYNGFMKADATATGPSKSGGPKTDYLSYADFLASDLNKKGMLGSYRNFAVSGYTIPQSRQLLLRDQGNLAMLQNTDLITLSIGANDFLSAVQVLDIPFHSISNSGEKSTNGDTLVTQINTARDTLLTQFGISATQEGVDKHYSGSASSYAAKAGIGKLIEDSFKKLLDIVKSGNLAGILDIQKDLYDKVFGLIQLDLATYINELHQAAPKAQIEIMGYAFPFHKLPNTIVNGVISDKGISMKEAFNKFIETLNETTARAKFVEFFDINKLKEFGEDSDQISYMRGGKEIVDHEWERVMPNVFDIHPSTYGHQVIAGHLFEELMTESKIVVPKYQSIEKLKSTTANAEIAKKIAAVYETAGKEKLLSSIQTAIGFDPAKNPFAILDEGVPDTHFGAQLGIDLLNSETIIKMLGSILSSIVDVSKIQDNYESILKAFSSKPDGTPYGTMAERLEGVASSLTPIAKTQEAKDIISGLQSTGTVFDKIKAIAKPIATILDKALPDGDDFKKIIVTIFNDLDKADFTGITALSIGDIIGKLIPKEANSDLVSDLIAMLVYLRTAPDDSKLLTVFKDLVSRMTLADRAALFGPLSGLPLALITSHGIWLPDMNKNFNSGDPDTIDGLAVVLTQAAKRIGVTLPLDLNTKSGMDQVQQFLLGKGGDSIGDLTRGLERIGLNDAIYFKTHDVEVIY